MNLEKVDIDYLFSIIDGFREDVGPKDLYDRLLELESVLLPLKQSFVKEEEKNEH